MIDLDGIKDLINEWIVAVTNLPALSTDQNNPFLEDEKPHFTFKISNVGSPGHDAKGFVGTNFTVKGDREFVVMIQGWGPGSLQKTYQLSESLELPEWVDFLAARGLTATEWPDVLDVSGLDGSESEERATFDPRMRIGSETIDTSIGSIETVKVGYEITGGLKGSITGTAESNI